MPAAVHLNDSNHCRMRLGKTKLAQTCLRKVRLMIHKKQKNRLMGVAVKGNCRRSLVVCFTWSEFADVCHFKQSPTVLQIKIKHSTGIPACF